MKVLLLKKCFILEFEHSIWYFPQLVQPIHNTRSSICHHIFYTFTIPNVITVMAFTLITSIH